MKIIRRLLLIVFSLAGVFLYAYEGPILVRIVPFTFDNTRANEGRLIESLVASYIADMDGITVFVDTLADEADSFSLIDKIALAQNEENYVLYGSITIDNDNHILQLNLDDKQNTLIKKTKYVYKSAGEMALNIRSIVEEYFPKTSRTIFSSEALTITWRDISGTWQGDNGIEILRFSPLGNAIALFSSGASMELRWKIEDSSLIVEQASPNNYRYFYPMPQLIAQKVAVEAMPFSWKMFLFEHGHVLQGTITQTGVEFDTVGEVKRIVQGKIQKARWKKLSR